MALFEWKEDYSVGVNRFDEQHQQLFALMNAMFDAVHMGYSRSALQGTFQRMFDYTALHLSEEEKAMTESGYPFAVQHCQQHEGLRVKLGLHRERYQRGTAGIGLETVNFLLHWWTNHILTIDRQYKEFFAGLNVELAAKQ